MWNEDNLIEPPPADASLIVTEGEWDALACISIGEGHVVSVPDGANGKVSEGVIKPLEDTAFARPREGRNLKPGLDRFKRIILATDADGPGYILRDELAIRLGENRCWFLTYPPGTKDANEVLAKYGRDALVQVLAGAKPMVPDRLVRFSRFRRRSRARATRPAGPNWTGT